MPINQDPITELNNLIDTFASKYTQAERAKFLDIVSATKKISKEEGIKRRDALSPSEKARFKEYIDDQKKMQKLQREVETNKKKLQETANSLKLKIETADKQKKEITQQYAASLAHKLPELGNSKPTTSTNYTAVNKNSAFFAPK